MKTFKIVERCGKEINEDFHWLPKGVVRIWIVFLKDLVRNFIDLSRSWHRNWLISERAGKDFQWFLKDFVRISLGFERVWWRILLIYNVSQGFGKEFVQCPLSEGFLKTWWGFVLITQGFLTDLVRIWIDFWRVWCGISLISTRFLRDLGRNSIDSQRV